MIDEIFVGEFCEGNTSSLPTFIADYRWKCHRCDQRCYRSKPEFPTRTFRTNGEAACKRLVSPTQVERHFGWKNCLRAVHLTDKGETTKAMIIMTGFPACFCNIVCLLHPACCEGISTRFGDAEVMGQTTGYSGSTILPTKYIWKMRKTLSPSKP